MLIDKIKGEDIFQDFKRDNVMDEDDNDVGISGIWRLDLYCNATYAFLCCRRGRVWRGKKSKWYKLSFPLKTSSESVSL